MLIPFLLRLLGMVAVPLVASCAGGYHQDFREAVAAQPVPPTSPLGPWKGEWRSEVNGHHGPLWCVIRPDGPDHHDFRYRAGWGALQFGDYTHRAATRTGDGAIEFNGEMDLPGGVGVYQVEGRVTAEKFSAKYRSDRGDRGTMEMSRP
ncbi:hypothetical protein HAHE_09380 [Haloferula helveola]|uniref:Uncharacterized protein n=1 Tax=Haloferula helveola TaxID=490095 RepID=A0ABM7R7Z6_9BACT|nr:hypothetical protein HAHE_09380 [Haloferula helveola]